MGARMPLTHLISAVQFWQACSNDQVCVTPLANRSDAAALARVRPWRRRRAWRGAAWRGPPTRGACASRRRPGCGPSAHAAPHPRLRHQQPSSHGQKTATKFCLSKEVSLSVCHFEPQVPPPCWPGPRTVARGAHLPPVLHERELLSLGARALARAVEAAAAGPLDVVQRLTPHAARGHQHHPHAGRAAARGRSRQRREGNRAESQSNNSSSSKMIGAAH